MMRLRIQWEVIAKGDVSLCKLAEHSFYHLYRREKNALDGTELPRETGPFHLLG